MSLEIGNRAPELNIPDSENKIVSIKDYAGKWVVIYFYPKDSTPGCTIEGIDFTRKLSRFKAFNAEVVGISGDSVESHCKFINKQNLEVTLLSDTEHAVLERYGVWQMKKNFGKEYFGIVRSTFLVDPEGKIQHIWNKVSVKGHVDAVLTKLKEFNLVKQN